MCDGNIAAPALIIKKDFPVALRGGIRKARSSSMMTTMVVLREVDVVSLILCLSVRRSRVR